MSHEPLCIVTSLACSDAQAVVALALVPFSLISTERRPNWSGMPLLQGCHVASPAISFGVIRIDDCIMTSNIHPDKRSMQCQEKREDAV